MKWWTYLKGWAKQKALGRVPWQRARETIRVCADCPFSQIHLATEDDFLDTAGRKAVGVGSDRAIMTCGTPGKPDVGTCGCWVGAEGSPEDRVDVTIVGRHFRAICKTETKGERCPQGFWSN